MADNFQGNPGSGGDTFASDEISGVHYSRIKQSYGRDGVAADVGTVWRLPGSNGSAATTNANNVKASAGTLYSIIAVNTNAAVRYLKFYNLASAPTVGSSPIHMTVPIPGNTAGGGVAINLGPGADFSTGISMALTTGSADSDTSAVAAGEIFVTLVYV